jgi:hypothetical protein
LDEPEAADGGDDVDGAEDDGSDVAVVNAGATKDGSAVVEEEVYAWGWVS